MGRKHAFNNDSPTDSKFVSVFLLNNHKSKHIKHCTRLGMSNGPGGETFFRVVLYNARGDGFFRGHRTLKVALGLCL